MSLLWACCELAVSFSQLLSATTAWWVIRWSHEYLTASSPYEFEVFKILPQWQMTNSFKLTPRRLTAILHCVSSGELSVSMVLAHTVTEWPSVMSCSNLCIMLGTAKFTGLSTRVFARFIECCFVQSWHHAQTSCSDLDLAAEWIGSLQLIQVLSLFQIVFEQLKII